MSQSIQPQQKQPQEDADDAHKDSTKLALKEIRFRGHPDIVRITKKKELDPPDSSVKKKLEEGLSSDQDSSEDSDTDNDEQIYVPNKSRWLKMCLDKWGVKDDDALRSQVRTGGNNFFEIYTASFYSKDGDSGCGAIIRDSCHRPIVARCKVISQGECVSPFNLELEGVALGVKLAKEYNVFPFYQYCPSEYVSLSVMQNWSLQSRCYCNGTWEVVDSLCKTCSKQSMFSEDCEDHEKAFQVILDILSDISQLKSCGLPWFHVGYGGRNEAAYLVAQLGEDKDLKLKEIGESEDLWNTIYEEVFGQYIKLPW